MGANRCPNHVMLNEEAVPERLNVSVSRVAVPMHALRKIQRVDPQNDIVTNKTDVMTFRHISLRSLDHSYLI